MQDSIKMMDVDITLSRLACNASNQGDVLAASRNYRHGMFFAYNLNS